MSKIYIIFFLFGILSSACSVFKYTDKQAREPSSVSNFGRNCIDRLKLLTGRRKAYFIDELRDGGSSVSYFENSDSFKKLNKYINYQRMDKNYFYGKEIFYYIDKDGFSFTDNEIGFSGKSFIKNDVLHLEINGASSQGINNRLIVDILNSFILSSMIAKENFNHLKSVRLKGKGVINQKLANLLYRLGFNPIKVKKSYDDLDFSEYFKQLIEDSDAEEEQFVDGSGNSVNQVGGDTDLYNDLFLDLDFK